MNARLSLQRAVPTSGILSIFLATLEAVYWTIVIAMDYGKHGDALFQAIARIDLVDHVEAKGLGKKLNGGSAKTLENYY